MFAGKVIFHSQIHPKPHVCIDDWRVVELSQTVTFVLVVVITRTVPAKCRSVFFATFPL